jgi:hypothetical protein
LHRSDAARADFIAFLSAVAEDERERITRRAHEVEWQLAAGAFT